jgi:diguanylate cyclase (GGDEF)-like protein
MIQQIKRDGGYLSLIILDVDNFKLYNDFYGHQAGDKALIAVAGALRDSLNRGHDYCFRLGGEEFGVVFKSANEDDAYLFAQKLRKAISDLEIEHLHNESFGILTASFGLVTLKSDCLTTEEDIYKKADEHLYLAKRSGRNKVVSKSI